MKIKSKPKEIRFLGFKFVQKLTIASTIEDIKERCNSRLNLTKILSNKKWGLKFNLKVSYINL